MSIAAWAIDRPNMSALDDKRNGGPRAIISAFDPKRTFRCEGCLAGLSSTQGTHSPVRGLGCDEPHHRAHRRCEAAIARGTNERTSRNCQRDLTTSFLLIRAQLTPKPNQSPKLRRGIVRRRITNIAESMASEQCPAQLHEPKRPIAATCMYQCAYRCWRSFTKRGRASEGKRQISHGFALSRLSLLACIAGHLHHSPARGPLTVRGRLRIRTMPLKWQTESIPQASS